jgi:hypothetical protein
METFKERRPRSEVFHELNENDINPKILYPAKLSFKIDGAIKVFHTPNTPKGKHTYQSIFTQCQCTQFHQTYSEGPKNIYNL